MTNQPWIGVDLDGTLAHYDGWKGVDHIGDPVPLMLNRVRKWLAEGKHVRIFTARVCRGMTPLDTPKDRSEFLRTLRAIEDWCEKHIGTTLPITCKKDFGMVELWDDRCVQVIPNVGSRADGLLD